MNDALLKVKYGGGMDKKKSGGTLATLMDMYRGAAKEKGKEDGLKKLGLDEDKYKLFLKSSGFGRG